MKIDERELAISGADALVSAPFPCWPEFAGDERAAVDRVLGSGKVNYWTGNEGRAFEKEFAEYVGSRYGVALSNGSVALELALRCLGVRSGDEVIVTPRTFIASASSIVLCGARPVFTEVDRGSQNMTADLVRPHITSRTRAIVVVHLGGWPCDIDPIIALAKKHDLKVVEDCAQAHGATYKGKPVGSFGDAAAFSFCQDKIMSTGGEGGMLVTDSEMLWKKAWAFKDHGKSFDAVYNQEPHAGCNFRWLHESFGTNWRMTEMQAAIGRVQLGKLAQWTSARRSNAKILIERLSGLPALRIPVPTGDFVHSYYKFYAFVQPDKLKQGWDRDRIIAAINAEGVPCFSGSCSEVYREKAFVDAGLGPADYFPVARDLGTTALMLLVHPTLSSKNIEQMANAVEKVMSVAQG